MTYHIRMEIIHREVCGTIIKRHNWVKHLRTKKHKKETKDGDLTHLAEVFDWKRCWKCHAHRSLDTLKGGNETCNRCLGGNKTWAENHKKEKKKGDGRKDEKKEYNKEYAIREVVCLTCGCFLLLLFVVFVLLFSLFKMQMGKTYIE